MVSKFLFLEFRLLLSRVAPYLQFFATDCLIINQVFAKGQEKGLLIETTYLLLYIIQFNIL
jgi:hypothetical protein